MLNNQIIVSTVRDYHFISVFVYFIFLLTLIVGVIVWNGYINKNKLHDNSSPIKFIINCTVQAARIPIFFLVLIYLGYLAIQLSTILFPLDGGIYKLLNYLLNQAESLVYFWLIMKIFENIRSFLLNWLANRKQHPLLTIIATLCQGLKIVLIMLWIIYFIPVLGITGLQEQLLKKVVKFLLIGTIGWIFFQTTQVVEQIILYHINMGNDNSNNRARVINTQVSLLKKILQMTIIVIVIAAELMIFDSVRNLGAGLLTAAGVLGAIGAFAIQKSLSSLFTGFQLAFSQPIRIGDLVTIDNENGQIEEMTLTYVVIKLWNLKRLILPTDYFFSKGLQNSTMNSTELLGTIFIYADFTLPIDIIREKFFQIIKESEFWNKNTATLQVTDINQNTLELRGLMSAADENNLWNLRCKVREDLIKFIVKNYPESLPVQRNMSVVKEKQWHESLVN